MSATLSDAVVGLALTQRELRVVIRGVAYLVEAEGWSQAASDVAQMVSSPLDEGGLAVRESDSESA